MSNEEREQERGVVALSVDSKIVELELYRLLAIVLASRPLNAAMTHNICEPLNNLRQHGETEFHRVLVSTAIMLRRYHDWSATSGRGLPQDDAQVCGVLRSGGKEEPLLLRTACNKIIHANDFNFDIKRECCAELEDGYIEPWIHLTGRYNQSDWSCTVDFVQYARAGALLVR